MCMEMGKTGIPWDSLKIRIQSIMRWEWDEMGIIKVRENGN